MRLDTQRRLVELLNAGMLDKEITHNEMARKIGTSSSMISGAFACKHSMRDERWRMVCEAVGIDYDQTMQQIEEYIRREADQSAPPAANQEGEQTSTGGLRITSMEGDWCAFRLNSDYGVDVTLKNCFIISSKDDAEAICNEIRTACRMMLGNAYDDA